MAGANGLMRSTSVNLYESDIKELEKRGLSISETIRELIHHICEYNAHDIFFSVRKGQAAEQLDSIEKRISKLKERRVLIDEDIERMEQQRDIILENMKILDSQVTQQQMWERICQIGNSIDIMIYQCDFDYDAVIEKDIPEIAEMQSINPGWSLKDHIEMRKRICRVN